MRPRRGVAVGAVRIGCLLGIASADDRACQAVAGLARFEEARLLIGIAAGPIAAEWRLSRRQTVNQPEEISRRVISVMFVVAAHRLPVARLRETHAARIIPRRLRL